MLFSPYAKWNLRILQEHQKHPALGGWSFLYTRQTEETGEIVSILLAPYCFFQNIIPSRWDLLPTSALSHYCHLLTFWSLLLKFMGIWQLVSYKLALHPSFCQNLQGFQKVNISYQVAAWFLGFWFITTGPLLQSISMTPFKRENKTILTTIWVIFQITLKFETQNYRDKEE